MALLIDQHLRPGQVNAPGKPPTSRALHRFHSAVGGAVTPLCWLFLADSLATVGASALLPRWEHYIAHIGRIISWQPQCPKQLGRLLDGHAIMEVTGLDPGPLVGQTLTALDEAVATGQVTTRTEATEFAQQTVDEMRASAVGSA